MKMPQSSAAMFLCLVALCLPGIGLLAQSKQSQSAQTHDQSADQHGKHAAHMEHRFDDAERWAKSFDDPARDAWQLPDRVVDALAIRSGQIVADVGAGTGYFTVRLARAAALKVFAVDIEPSMVAYVRKRAAREGIKNVVAVQATSDRTNLPEPVDLVNVFRPSADATGVVREAIAIGAPAVWLQLDIVSPVGRRLAEQAGIDYVEDTCIAVIRALSGLSRRPSHTP